MFSVYVLYSISFDKIYIGFTSDLKSRFLSHNELDKNGWTSRFRPWIVVYTEEYQTKKEALCRERELKSAKGRDFIWKIIRKGS
jgi:putative endonuclease